MPRQEHGADAAEVRRLIAKGNSKTALEAAKQLHKTLGTPATEDLLVDAYLARSRSMLEHGLAPEAEALLAMVRERYPSAREKLKNVQTAISPGGVSLDDLLRPLNDPELSPELRASIEGTIRNIVTDLSALARSAALDSEHPLRRAAAALDRGFQAVTSGLVEDAALELPEVSRRSPLAPWKPLLRAIACFYRHEDAACREHLRAITPESAPARLIPALEAMLPGGSGEALSPAGAALSSQVTGNQHELRAALCALDDAFEGDYTKTTLQRVRAAVSLAQQQCPNMLASLRQQIAVRATLLDAPPSAIDSAMGGAVRRDAHFCRMLARALEMDEGTAILACCVWAEFRVCALREGWFRDESPEAATLYLHMATVAGRIPPDEAAAAREQVQEQLRSEMPGNAPTPELEVPFLDAGVLYELACSLDPHAEAFESWLHWAEQNRKANGASTEKVAEAWRRALPNDPRPLLCLMREAESRDALKKALQYLEQAEALDGLNPEVRGARLRLLLSSAIRYLKQRKTRLAERELLKLADVPQARENDRPAFVAGLRRAACLLDGDNTAAAAAQAQIDGLLGGRRAGALAAARIAQLCMLPPQLPANSALAAGDTFAGAAARVCAMAHDLGFYFSIPNEWRAEIIRELGKSAAAIDTAALVMLGRAALRENLGELAYAVSAAGLDRGGASEARFLLLRAQAIPTWYDERRDECLSAAIELARRQRDMDLVGEALAVRRDGFLGWLRDDVKIEGRQLNSVLERERRQRTFHAGSHPAFGGGLFEDGPVARPRPRRRRRKPSEHKRPQEEMF